MQRIRKNSLKQKKIHSTHPYLSTTKTIKRITSNIIEHKLQKNLPKKKIKNGKQTHRQFNDVFAVTFKNVSQKPNENNGRINHQFPRYGKKPKQTAPYFAAESISRKHKPKRFMLILFMACNTNAHVPHCQILNNFSRRRN